MADYHSHPLWDVGSTGPDNVEPSTLPISKALVERLERWAERYDATLDQDDPAGSGFTDDAARESFVLEGRALAAELDRQLGPDHSVTYFEEPATP